MPWHFREMSRGEINVDPVHDEFFKAQDLADALVREAIQNSLDARRGRAGVRVRFRIGSLEIDRANQYLDGLEPHVHVPQFAAMPFLLVEDSGTRGLVGNPDEDPEIDDSDGTRNDFYYFWRNVGRSGKGELDRGRWGLGKAVFPVSSRIHAMFGATRRADDDRLLMLGQAVGKTHVVDNRRFSPYGFFARIGRDDFPHPIEDVAARFIEHFGLQRDEPGLSIVIPFYRDDDLKFDALLASAIRQYFYPITRGDLIVTIEENERVETITGCTIERETSDPELVKVCELARWSMALPESEWITIAEPAAPGAPRWGDDAILARELDALRARFEQNDRLAFRVPVRVRRKSRAAAMSFFSVVLQKDDALKRGVHYFIRRGITIPEVRSPHDKPVRALLIADDEAISTFLGDAENPAHSDWSERNDKVRLYEYGRDTLRYVKNAIAQIASRLAVPPAGRAPDLLADLFAVSVAAEESGERGDGDGGASAPLGGEGTGAPPVVASGSSLRIVPIAGGFTVSGNHANGDRYRAEVAYRTRSGDPFRKYSPFDFAIGRGGIRVKQDGVELGAARENRIDFQPLQPDFQLTVTGFDPRRDLVVRVTKRDEDAPETELH